MKLLSALFLLLVMGLPLSAGHAPSKTNAPQKTESTEVKKEACPDPVCAECPQEECPKPDCDSPVCTDKAESSTVADCGHCPGDMDDDTKKSDQDDNTGVN